MKTDHSCTCHEHSACSCGHEHHHENHSCSCHHEEQHHEDHTCSCGCGCHNHSDHGDSGIEILQIIIGALLFVIAVVLEHMHAPAWLLVPVALFGYLLLGGSILKEGFLNLRRGHVLDENFLMGIATLGAIAIRNYPEALGVMLFYRIGEAFEHRAVARSRSRILETLDLRPEVVSRIEGEAVHEIPAGEARVGDVLRIRPGDRIPLDGTILEGDSRLDTSPITGEPLPRSVRAGDAVLSGCINISGMLKLRVEKPLSQSLVSRILNCVENAAAAKPKIDRFITRFARIYTPCVVLIALLTALIPSLITGRWNYWIYTALSFLVMSCPCALVLSVPLAFFSGIGAGSRKNILFKGGAAIEAMAGLKAVVLDKTGTITRGDFRLQKIISLSKLSEDELLAICASCEAGSSHPIAHSITAAAAEKHLPLEAPASLQEIAGHGVQAQLRAGSVLCGNRRLMQLHHVDLSSAPEHLGGSRVFVAVNGSLAGVLVIADTIKPDAADAIRKLKSMGLQVVMLTGDSRENAEAVAGEAGIDRVHARLLPQEKLEILRKIRSEHGAVMFVGDGINDAPVLAGADVGAAMGSGADAAIEAADAVYMRENLCAVPDSIRIARSTRRIARQNVAFALAVKGAVMLLGLCGMANMWLAVFADSGVAVLCVLNSIRALVRK